MTIVSRRINRARRRECYSNKPVDWFAGLIVLALVVFGIVTTPANWPPCPTEDSTNCHWDASQHGNNRGESFTTVSIFGADVTF